MGQNWVCEETSRCDLGDARLNRRPGSLLSAIGERPGKSLPRAFQDWANTKAAYRFFANGNLSEDKILEGRFAASAQRIETTDGPILILQDTTEFSFKRASPEKIGFTRIATGPKGKDNVCDLRPDDVAKIHIAHIRANHSKRLLSSKSRHNLFMWSNYRRSSKHTSGCYEVGTFKALRSSG